MKKAVIRCLADLDYSGAEALNTICSNLSFAGRDLKKIVMTSCTADDGKSFMAMHTMRNLAKRGRRVVLVDADLRRSYLVRKYDIETDDEWRGLAHYLAGYCGIDDVLYETDLDGACIVPAGRDVTNPVPLLDTPYFATLLDQLVEQFDTVLVDAPPVGLVIDAAEIARSCDGVVFVVEYNKTRRRELMDAKHQMKQAGCPILGCVINKVSFDSLSAKKYYNKSYYSHYNSEYYLKPDYHNGQSDKAE